MATTRTPEQKVILCGEFGAGKSSIFRRYANDTFVTSTDRSSTLGLDHYSKVFPSNDREMKVNYYYSIWRVFVFFFKSNLASVSRVHWTLMWFLFLVTQITQLQLWDTGGMERVASVTSSYYKFAEGAILVFALDNASSFHALSQHLLDIVTYAENAKIFLCGNKADLCTKEPQVSICIPLNLIRRPFHFRPLNLKRFYTQFIRYGMLINPI